MYYQMIIIKIAITTKNIFQREPSFLTNQRHFLSNYFGYHKYLH